jgi:hypothetical protein
MKRLVLVSGLALALVAGAGGATAPALKLVRAKPLTIQGVRFVPGERVTVTLTKLRVRRTRRAAATAAGRFVVRFDVPLSRCGATVRAVGSQGSRATLKRPPLPGCMAQ